MPLNAPSSSGALRGELPGKLAAAVKDLKEKLAAAPKEIASRAASEFALDALTAALPDMIGGSADLTGSNNTRAKGMKVLQAPRLCRHASSITACASTAWRRP